MNENIKEYLDHYLQIKNPSFAVLIKGSWGSGKTWYLKKYIREYVSNRLSLDPEFKDPFLFVSLYGVNVISDIDDKLFEQMHPLLGSTPVRVASKIFQGIIKFGVATTIGSTEVSESIPEIDLKSMFKKLDDKVIVFDDVERSNLDLRSLFGYINNFVELKNQRTILLANDKEINDKEIFKNTQEKIIGKTFLLEPDIQSAIDSFYGELVDTKLKDVFHKNRDVTIELFTKVGKSNLRNLRQSILHFEYFYKLIGAPHNMNKEFISELIVPFFCISLQFKNGDVDEENWNVALSGYLRQKMDVLAYAAYLQDKSRESEMRYGDLYLSDAVPLLDLWPDLLLKGSYEIGKIKSSISNAKYFVEEKMDPLTKLMRTFRTMKSQEFSETVEVVIKRFKSNVYTNPGDILHVFDILTLFSQWKLIDISTSKIKNMVSKQVEIMKLAGIIEPVDIRRQEFLHFGGFSFNTRDTKEFKTVFKQIENVSVGVIKTNLRAELKYYLETMSNSFLDFCRNLCRFEGDGKFAEEAVLALVNADDFADKYFKLDSGLQNSFVYALRDRYELKYDNGSIQDLFDVEYKFITKMIFKIKGKLKTEGLVNNPPNFMLKGVLEDLEKIKSRFDQKFEKRSNA